MIKYLLLICTVILSNIAYSMDIYNPYNQQLTIPTVNVNETVYTNVVVTLGSIISIGGSINPRTTATFPIQQAIKNMYSNGIQQKTLKINGTNQNIAASGSITLTSLSGLGSITLLPQTSVLFKGVASYSVALNQTINSLNATTGNTTIPAGTGSGSDTIYLNTNYQPIGYQYYQGLYCEAINPGNYPAKAVIGQSGIIASYNCWSSGTKNPPDWSIIETYETTPDTSGNMIFKIIKSTYYSGDNTLTNQDTFSLTITTSGNANITGWSTSNIFTQSGCTKYPSITCSISEINMN